MLDDVNQAPEEFNSEPSAEVTNENGQGQEPSAETLNSDNEPRGPVPYERFQEKVSQYNDLDGKYKQLEQELNPYREKQVVYQAYEKFDRLLQESPQEALQLIKTMVEEAGQGQQIDPYANQALRAATQALQTSQNIVLSNYKNDLSSFIESEGIPEDLAPVVESLATQAMGRYNQNPLAAYDKASAQKALADVKKFIDTVYNSRQAQYTKQKQSTETPPNNSGIPAVKKPDYLDKNVRRAGLREMFANKG